jgi:hypothetical protein
MEAKGFLEGLLRLLQAALLMDCLRPVLQQRSALEVAGWC